jgi:hypothetical protein
VRGWFEGSGFVGSRLQGSRGSRFVGFEVRNAIDQIEVKAKDPFAEIVASLLDAADPQFDLRASAIETFEAFQYFGAELFEAQHGASEAARGMPRR